MKYIKPIVKGLMTYVPGLMYIRTSRIARQKATAAYSYNIWLRHLTMLYQQGMTELPQVVAELGPGGSLGVGMAALLSGVNTYHALDVVRHINIDQNLDIFDGLVDLFQNRSPLDTTGWPSIKECLGETEFPEHILTEKMLADSLSEERINWLRDEIKALNHNNSGAIQYVVPWDDPRIIDEGSVELIISHAVLEHVSSIATAYDAMHKWLMPGGWMSHQIDFRSHNLTDEWNGHWAYPNWLWALIVGRRPYLINREPHSEHVKIMQEKEYEIKCDLVKLMSNGIPRSKLSTEWKGLSDEDFKCSEAFIQARKTSNL